MPRRRVTPKSNVGGSPATAGRRQFDPFISFGKAVITGTGVSTDIVAERFKAGESADELAHDYGCAREKIEEAIRCELNLAEAA